ncbi:MAG TPA: hypothetical protein VIA18_27065, partial [Polyangia bacterium]|nr:hypothetical protein [Polyangia bacterium]
MATGCVGSATSTPPSSSNDGVLKGVVCPPSPAPQLFTNAICLCDDFADVGAALVAHGSTGAPASVGVNGHSLVVGADQIDGDFVSAAGVSGTGSLDVGGNLATTGDMTGVGKLDVGGDLSVGGNLTGIGALSVAGTMRVAGQSFTLGARDVHATGPSVAPAAPPCACDGSTFRDVAAKVAAAKTQNDNAKQSLPTSIAGIGASSITLPTGSYYFTDVENIGATRFVIDGIVALYLDGSLAQVGAEQLQLSAGAQLDLYVAGSVASVGALSVSGDPSAVRLYVGGAGAAVLSVGVEELDGAIYAPTAEIAFVGAAKIHGAVFGKSLAAVGLLDVDYVAPTAPPANQCTPTGSAGG